MVLFIPVRSMKTNTIIGKPLFMSLFVSVFLSFLAVIVHARTLSESRRETLTSLPPTPSSAALQKMTYPSWDKFMTITYQKPSAASPPPPDSSDSPDQITEGSTSHCSGERFCSGFKRIYYDCSLSIAENDNIRSMVDYNKKESSPPPPPSSSTSPVTVAKPSDSSPPSPSSSESLIQIPHNSPQIPTIAIYLSILLTIIYR